MRAKTASSEIALRNLIDGSAVVRRAGPAQWRVRQRYLGPDQDHAQTPTWLEISNPGRAARVRLQLAWADARLMYYRRWGYLEQDGRCFVLPAALDGGESIYEFEAPSGVSRFASQPWTTCEDAERFIAAILRRSRDCRRRVIGRTAEGREISCLTIGDPALKRPNVVVLARVHATESSGTFAVQATASFLLGSSVPAAWRRDFCFHLFPVANPDGVAHGMKTTRDGPVAEYDIERGGMTSGDPTAVALREEMFRLRPVCIVDHHSYLFKAPMLYVYDKATAVAFLERVLDGRPGVEAENDWHVHVQPAARPTVLRDQCYKRFKSTVIVSELSWYGRLPAEIERQGVKLFRAAMEIHTERMRR